MLNSIFVLGQCADRITQCDVAKKAGEIERPINFALSSERHAMGAGS